MFVWWLIVPKTEKWNRNAMEIAPKNRSDETEKENLFPVVIVEGETSKSVNFKAVGWSLALANRSDCCHSRLQKRKIGWSVLCEWERDIGEEWKINGADGASYSNHVMYLFESRRKTKLWLICIKLRQQDSSIKNNRNLELP